MPILIGLHAPMCGGKTTVANLMVQRLDAEIISIATPLKDVARSMGWDGKKDDKGRKLLQLLGTECGRKCVAPDIWMKLWLEKAKASTKQFVIADDLRWPPAEARMINDRGHVFRVIGRETPLSFWQRVKRWLGLSYCHASEIPIPDSIGLTLTPIDNTGSLTDLEDEVGRICDDLKRYHPKKKEETGFTLGSAVHLPTPAQTEEDPITRSVQVSRTEALMMMLIAGAASRLVSNLDNLSDTAIALATERLRATRPDLAPAFRQEDVLMAMARLYIAKVDPRDENAVNHACFPNVFPLNPKGPNG